MKNVFKTAARKVLAALSCTAALGIVTCDGRPLAENRAQSVSCTDVFKKYAEYGAALDNNPFASFGGGGPYNESGVSMMDFGLHPKDHFYCKYEQPFTPFSSRALTEDEMGVARKVFGDEIDYSKVRVHNSRYEIMESNNALGSHIFFWGRNDYARDYSKDKTPTFLHEMTHVWQFQNGHIPFSKAAIQTLVDLWKHHLDYDLIYSYGLAHAPDFNDMNIEQQAKAVEHYTTYHFLGKRGDNDFHLLTGYSIDLADEFGQKLAVLVEPALPAASISRVLGNVTPKDQCLPEIGSGAAPLAAKLAP